MQKSPEIWKESPLRRLAERSIETPGIYLMALRTHLNRGQKTIGEMLETVADALPGPPKLQTSDES